MFNRGDLDKAWVPRNQLTEARDRRLKPMGRLNDALINGGGALAPLIPNMVNPMVPPIIPNMVRKMGENTIQTRRRPRNSLWAGTPAMALGSKTIGEIDITSDLAEWDCVGWDWNRRTNKLEAHLTSKGQTYVVRIPLNKLQRIFNRCVATNGGNSAYFKETSIDGFFQKLGKGLKSAVKGAVRGATAPIRFVKNPKKFVKETGQEIKKFVKGVGKVALKVASHPAFAGVMTAIAAIPPLTAVGGVGLAAYAAANAIKPAFKAVEAGIDTVDAIAKKKKAGQIINNMASGINAMPGPAKGLMKAALKSVPDDIKKPVKKGAKPIFKLKNGILSQVM